MKSYFLVGYADPIAANEALCLVFPGQDASTRVLFDEAGDAIGYFYTGTSEDGEFEGFPLQTHLIQVDMSGRHYNEDAKIIAILAELRSKLGGQIFDDNDTNIP